MDEPEIDELIAYLCLGSDLVAHEAPFVGKSIFKYMYFSDERALRVFVEQPTVKFSSRGEMNDPFELNKRWKQTISLSNRAALVDYFRRYADSIVFSDEKIIGLFKKELSNRCSPGQRLFVEARMAAPDLSRVYGEKIAKFRSSYINKMRPTIEFLVEVLNFVGDRELDRILGDIGVSSYTEDPVNHAMWALYAGAGRGFVIEYDVSTFPRASDRAIPRLRKVRYVDEQYADFLGNPYSAFAVKNPSFSFEKEWREIAMRKELSKAFLPDGKPIYLRKLPRGAIKSVIAGHAMSTEHIHVLHGVTLSNPAAIIRRAELNHEKGEIFVREA